MVERVAKAIFASQANARSLDKVDQLTRESVLMAARAAIEAMREPTIGMIAMGGDEILPERMYRIMIDAALDDDMVDKDRK